LAGPRLDEIPVLWYLFLLGCSGRFLQVQGRHRAGPGERARNAAHQLHPRHRQLRLAAIVLERLDSRYVVTQRETFYQSDMLLTPYSSEDAIDADALGTFFEKQYENAMVDPDEIDAGALILTGVAQRPRLMPASPPASPRADPRE
jgi:hypothetical protein